MDQNMRELESISRAISSSFALLEREVTGTPAMHELEEAEKELQLAIMHVLQAGGK